MFSQAKHTVRQILLVASCCLLSSTAYTQSTDWQLLNGKAVAEKTMSLPGKNSTQIYREVNRWLVKVYTNPEDMLKARLHDEYLRGVGYAPNSIKFSAISSADLKYTFTFDIQDEKLVFRIFDAFLIYGDSQDDDGVFPVENSFVVKTGKKRKERIYHDSELIRASLSNFSNAMFQSIENHMAPTN